MGRMKELDILRHREDGEAPETATDAEQGFCPTVEFLLALAIANGEEVEEIYCNCEVCRNA